MKAHELARKLLEGPDLPVIHWDGEPPDLVEIDQIWPHPDPKEPWVSSWWPADYGSNTSKPAVRLA